jgi:clan AA aspartic protease
MGFVSTKLKLSNPRLPSLKPITVRAMVDTGAMTLCIPPRLAAQLKLDEGDKRNVTTADGRTQLASYVGPVEMVFEKRRCYGGAVVMGDEVLLGAVPMEDLDLIISPTHRKVVINPASPNFPSSLVK